jgi:hypothetical protein
LFGASVFFLVQLFPLPSPLQDSNFCVSILAYFPPIPF